MKGDINNPDKVEIEVKHFMLKDVGSAAYTEYEFGEEMVDLYEEMPELMQLKMGHLHTHHNMDAFFSGTDMRALHDGAESLDMLLSIIVNRKGKKIAKIAMISEMEKKVLFQHKKKKFYFKDKAKDVLSILDCELRIENEGKYGKEIELVMKQKQAKKDAVIVRQPQQTSEQLRLFDKEGLVEEVNARGEIIDNEELLSDKAISNLVVRSLAYDDMVDGTVSDTIKIINDMIEEFDMKSEVKNMMSHFLNTLQKEYYYDQFEYVIGRVLHILAEYRDDGDFVNKFCSAIEYWREEYIEDGKLDIGKSVDNLSSELKYGVDRRGRVNSTGKVITQEKEFEDEF